MNSTSSLSLRHNHLSAPPPLKLFPHADASHATQRLLAKSAENKTKNDAERFNYDKQYAANLAILNIVPDDQKTREKLSISRPKECDLPFFKDSPTCLKF